MLQRQFLRLEANSLTALYFYAIFVAGDDNPFKAEERIFYNHRFTSLGG